jgi:ATP-dependent DNA helicase PIF1
MSNEIEDSPEMLPGYWKIKSESTLSQDQQKFIDAVEEGKNIFLTGKAGTGKSHVTRAAMQLLKDKGLRVAALAPTGIAANNIGGATLHSTFSLRPFGVLDFEACNFVKQIKRFMLQAIDVVVIDEVSMLRPDILDALNWTLIKNGCGSLMDRQVIFIGDMKQLGIVADDNMVSVMLQKYGGRDFKRAEIYDKLNVCEIELTNVLRQSDDEFIEALNVVREGSKHPYFKQFLSSEQKGVVLAPHNSTVQKYNQEGLNSVDGKMYTFTAKIEGNAKADDFNLDPIINVKDGCKIMYLVNSKNNPLVNGTLGIFRVKDDAVEEERYWIEVQGVEYSLQKVGFTKQDYVFNPETNSLELQEIGSIEQYPFKLAYALTIHKSQGLTFEECTIDLSLPCFAEGQLYVALSRVKTPGGLSIIVNR